METENSLKVSIFLLKIFLEVAERLGKKLSKVNITRKRDTEIDLEVLEEPRGKDAFIIQVYNKIFDLI
jgi:phosphoribosylpyrophosphate synthetase